MHICSPFLKHTALCRSDSPYTTWPTNNVPTPVHELLASDELLLASILVIRFTLALVLVPPFTSFVIVWRWNTLVPHNCLLNLTLGSSINSLGAEYGIGGSIWTRDVAKNWNSVVEIKLFRFVIVDDHFDDFVVRIPRSRVSVISMMVYDKLLNISP